MKKIPEVQELTQQASLSSISSYVSVSSPVSMTNKAEKVIRRQTTDIAKSVELV